MIRAGTTKARRSNSVNLPNLAAQPGRRRTAFAALGLVILAGFAAIVVTMTPGNAETTPLPGVAVPAGTVAPSSRRRSPARR